MGPFRRCLLLAALLATVVPTAPRAAAPTSEASLAGQVARIERVTAELALAKRSGAEAAARQGRQRAAALRACTNGGPGWRRIRAVRHRTQRALYTRAARTLLAEMRALLAEQQPRIAAHRPAFARFAAGLDAAGVQDPLLQAAVAAHRRRLASYRDVGAIEAGCRVFNRLTGRVREFPARTPAQIVRVDYLATPIARRIERYVASRLRAAERRHGVSDADSRILERSSDLIVAQGGDAGYATAFRYALSLR